MPTKLSFDKPQRPKGLHILTLNFSDDKLPEFRVNKQRDIVTYGKENDFPNKLLEYYNRSAFHNAIINGKSNYITGGGIEYNQDLTAQEKAIVEKYIASPNPFMSLEDLIHRDAMNLTLFGGIPHQIGWSTNRKSFAVYALDFEKIRTNESLTKFYVKEEWKRGDVKVDENQTYPAFNPKTAEPMRSQINYFRMYRPGMQQYPLPEYSGAIQWLGIDTEIANFHYNNLKNGFAAGTMIELMVGAGMDDPQKDAIERKAKAKFGGTDNGGSIVLNFIEDENQKSNVVPLRPNDLDKQFEQLYEQARQAIFSGHGVTSPTLFGISTAGQLGQRAEMVDAYELFFATYVEMRQRVIEGIHNEYLKLMGVSNPGLKIKKSQPIGLGVEIMLEKGFITKDAAAKRMGISADEMPKEVAQSDTQRTIEAINALSPLVANNVLNKMTKNEIRALAGLPPIAGGDTIDDTPVNTTPVQTGFSAVPDGYTPPDDADKWKDEDAEIFAQFGEDAAAFETVATLEHDWLTDEESGSMNLKFAVDDLDAKILDLISRNDKINIADVADVTKMDIEAVKDIVSKLAARKLLKTGDGGSLVITPRGTVEIQDYGKEFRQIFVKYSYSGIKDDRNRPFCAKMLEMDKLYTRADIDKLSTMLGYDVWKRRGGWYTVPNSDPPLHLPYCRHTWNQVIVRKKLS